MTNELSGQLVLVCRHVLVDEKTVELVVHHADGKWQFMCGAYNHVSAEDAEVVHAEHIFEAHPELEKIALGLQCGFLAERLEGNWTIAAHDD